MTRTEGLVAVLSVAVDAEEWELVAHIAGMLSDLQTVTIATPDFRDVPARIALEVQRALVEHVGPEDGPTSLISADEPIALERLTKGLCTDHEAHGSLSLFMNDGGNIRGWCEECQTWWATQ